MRLILALLLPWLQFFTIGRPFAGIFCLILQITLAGSQRLSGRFMPFLNTIRIKKLRKCLAVVND